MAVIPAHNPPLSGNTVTVPVGDSDEVVEYPAGSPPAIEEPRTYNVIGVGINAQIIAGKPRNIYELAGNARGGHLWFPDIHSFGHSGKLMAFASLNADDVTNEHDQFVTMMSDDFGQAWPVQNNYDQSGFSNGACAMRHYDPSTGRLHEWNGFKMQPFPFAPTNRRTYRCRSGYYANGGQKSVRYPHGTTFGALPFDMTTKPWHPISYEPRLTWDAFFAEGTICEMADGAWAAVFDGEGDSNGQDPAGDHAYFTGFLFKSYDKGLTWQYVSMPGGPQNGVTENYLFRGPSGKLVCVYRNFGADAATDAPPNKVIISTDETATAWGSSFFPDPPNWTAGGRIGSAGTTGCRLSDGSHIVCAGRTGNDALNVSINIDGGDSVDSVWGWWSLTQHHDFYANDGGSSLATASTDPGLIHKFWPNPDASHVSSCYAAVCEIAPNEFMLIYDYTPQWRSEIGGQIGNLANCIYVVHAKLVRT